MAFHLRAQDAAIAEAIRTLFAGHEVEQTGWPLVFQGRDPHAFAPAHGLVCERRPDGFFVQLGSELAIAWTPKGAEAWVAQSADFFGPGVLQNVVRLCLALRGQLLLHASGIVHDGRAFIFAGKSGAGKSTLARLFPETALLGDEIMCIAADERVFRAPFTGERLPPPLPLSAQLGGIVCFSQGAFSLARADARAVLPHVVNPTHDRSFSAALVDRVLSLSVPVWRATLPMPTSEHLAHLLATVSS